MPDFDAKADTPATAMDAADKIPFGDVSADGWDTITAAKALKAIADVTDNAAGVRTALGLGTAAQQNTGAFDAAGAAAAAQAASQPLDADLTAIAAIATTDFGRALLTQADAAALRSAAALGSVATLDSDADGTLAANSDAKIATQKAVKTYVDANGGFDGTLEGTLIVRQSGGVAGTDEVHVSHDGTRGLVDSIDGELRLRGPGGLNVATPGFVSGIAVRNGDFGNAVSCRLGYTGSNLHVNNVYFGDPHSAVGDMSLNYVSAGVLKVGDGSTGGGQLEFPQVADVGTPSTNCGRLGAEDVGGTAELIASDEAGNETQITPHANDGPPELYDETPGQEHVIRTINRFAGTVEFLNLTRLAKAVESGTPAKCYHSEKLASFNARTGRHKAPLDWAAVQADKQRAYDEARADELIKLAEWQALPADRRTGQAPIVRPARSIVKPAPDWIRATPRKDPKKPS